MMADLFSLIHGSAHDTGLPDASVQCVVTSPPYWGLRKYAGEQGVEWPAVDYAPMPGLPLLHIDAMRCELGLEPTPEAYIGHMVLVMREMRRVLRDDGTCWVNLGDSYAANGERRHGGWNGEHDANYGNRPGQRTEQRTKGIYAGGSTAVSGLKAKDLCGIPWRFAFAAQADGWWLRSDIIWAKPNPMPESVTDRPTKAHEYVFLLAKSARYYWDANAVREDQQESSLKRLERGWNGDGDRGYPHGPQNHFKKYMGKTPEEIAALPGRNMRDVWTMATQPTPYAHFATYPEALAEKCILAGSKPGDVVLDPFSGSGTTGVVALRLGRAYVGVDISEEYLHGVTAERMGDGVQVGLGI